MPISFNLASVWTPRARTTTRPTKAEARRNMLVARVGTLTAVAAVSCVFHACVAAGEMARGARACEMLGGGAIPNINMTPSTLLF